MNIYVIDTGVNNVPDLAGRIRYARNFYPNSSGVVDPNQTGDCYNHGTPVATLAAGTTYGIATSATLVNLRVFGCINDQGDLSTIADAVDWMYYDHIQQHPDEMAVANISMEGHATSQLLDQAIIRAVQAGITIVVCAGNTPINTATIDACAASPAHLGNANTYPAGNGASVITVGATGGDTGCTACSQNHPDTVAPYSAQGQCVDLFAPGALVNTQGADGYYMVFNGTSAAAPHVAGVAALHMERYALTNSPGAIEGFIKDNATAGVISGLWSTSPNLLLYNGILRRRACCG